MGSQVKNIIIKAIQFAQFITLSYDEIPTIDNKFYICVHAYVVEYWTKIFILVYVDRIVNELDFNNHIEVIMVILFKGGGLIKEELSKKLLCFEINWVNVFIGGRT